MDALRRTQSILAWVLIALGGAQWFATPFLFETAEEPAFWFWGGGLTLSVIGALNLLRLRYGATARGVVVVSIASNVVLAVFWAAMAHGLKYKFDRYGAPYVALTLIVLNAALSVHSSHKRSL